VDACARHLGYDGTISSKELARRSYDYRTLGLGYANLGGLLMSSGIAYDSDEGRALCGAISAMMTAQAYYTSAEMHRPSFLEAYHSQCQSDARVLTNHARAACGETPVSQPIDAPRPLDIKAFGTSTIPERIKPSGTGSRHGRLAWLSQRAGKRHRPNRTIGLLMDCDTTESSPISRSSNQEACRGGYFKIINRTVPAGLRALGYTRPRSTIFATYAVGMPPYWVRPTSITKASATKDSARRNRRNREQATSRLRHQIRFQQWTLGADFSTQTLELPADALEDPKLTF